MRFFFDIDGVVLDFEKTFLLFLEGLGKIKLPKDYQPKKWVLRRFVAEEDIHDYWKLFMQAEEISQMFPLVSAERFNAITAGFPVHFLTNFPSAVMHKREENMKELGFRYTTLHYAGLDTFDGITPPRKGEMVKQLLEEEGEGLFVDDRLDNCVDVFDENLGVEVCLMQRRKKPKSLHAGLSWVGDWDMLEELIRKKTNHKKP